LVPYSQAIAAWLRLLPGQIPIDRDGQFAGASIEEQTHQV